jgi:alpha-beta hydrolase superfamily lysophospholipase
MNERRRPRASIWQAEVVDAAASVIEPRDWTFRASDGYELAVLSWPVPHVESRGDVLLLHGVQSHAGWYHALGRRLAAAGYAAHFPDRRGSGMNTNDRGHAPSARRIIDDVVELAKYLRAQGRGPLHLVGISWGGKLAVVSAANHAGLFDSLVLLAPGLHPRVGVSLGEKLRVALALLTGRAKRAHFAIPLADPALFTDNPEAQKFLRGDPLSLRTASAGLLFASRIIDRWVARCPGRLTLPLLLMLAEHDRIVDNQRTLSYFDAIPESNKSHITLPGATHTPEFGPDSEDYANRLIAWFDQLPLAKGAASHANRAPAGGVEER